MMEPTKRTITSKATLRVRVTDKLGQALLDETYHSASFQDHLMEEFDQSTIAQFFAKAITDTFREWSQGFKSSAKIQLYAQKVGGAPSQQLTSRPSTENSAGGFPRIIATSDVDELPAFKATPRKNRYAVVIGIEQYRDRLPRADFANRDAVILAQYLTKAMGYPEENVTVLLNEKASLTDITKYLEAWLPNNVPKDGSVFVYYSGHGAPNAQTKEAYLVPYDGDPSFLNTTSYGLNRLYRTLEKLPAKEIIVALDACFSGAGGRSVLAEGARPMGLSIENPVLASQKLAVLAASTGTQISATHLEQAHGLFTYFLLKGLRGEGDANRDGTVALGELASYLTTQVPPVARQRYNTEQTPQFMAPPGWAQQVRLSENVR